MTTLTALKLERELQIARAGLAAEAPKLRLQWRICPTTGRAIAAWVADVPACALEEALAEAAPV